MVKIFIAISIFLFISPAYGQSNKFIALDYSQEIHVEYTSQGCFGISHRLFEFKGGRIPIVRILNLKKQWSEDKKQFIEISRELLGSVKLLKNELHQLDNLFGYYKSLSHPGGCTTVDTISVKYLKKSKLLKSETFIDATCNTYNQKDIITFYQLEMKIYKDTEPNA